MNIIEEKSYKDTSTIFSIYPHELNEFKPGIYPGRFVIPACYNEEDPIRFTLGVSIHLVNLPDKPAMQLETPSYRVAEAIVRDFLGAVPELDLASNAKPGICYFHGDVSLYDFKTKHKDKYLEIKTCQDKWFINLIKRADNDWNRYRSHNVIMPMAIFAAKKLGMTADDKEWLMDAQAVVDQPRCDSCMQPVHRLAVTCSCGYILRPDMYKKMVAEGRIIGKVA